MDLEDGWSLMKSAPAEFSSPSDVPSTATWRPAQVPGTVASAVGAGAFDGHDDYDRFDWWYRCTLPSVRSSSGSRIRLGFDGLATIAEAWVDETRILESSNMFVSHDIDVTDLVGKEGGRELTIVFRSLHRALERRRPRGRWKTKLVEEQQLRWFRTTLLGRIPGWTPRIAPVGPWRRVWLESVEQLDVKDLSLRTAVDGVDGIVTVRGAVEVFGWPLESAALQVGGSETGLTIVPDEDGWSFHGDLRVEDVELWWPHTHGRPTLHPCSLRLSTQGGDVKVDCGRIGFRTVEMTLGEEGAFRVNGEPVFCRGACWTSNDVLTLSGELDAMRRSLGLAAAAHANMVRVGGTMVYERDEFYEECDRLGLMVWQDFMFANMDYPVDDESFAESVRTEARQQIARLSPHPCVVAFCGSSEVEQQAAMFGAPEEAWTNVFFAETLPELIRNLAPDRPYWPSTPTGGSLPFRVGEGLAHYYGVGAYLRPLEDVRSAGVLFTTECLGFSNVPEPSNLSALSSSASHHPEWKAGIPRDSGAGWDFEDVRDHYLRTLCDVDPIRLRSEDTERYLRLSRTVTGRIMERVFDEWRSPDNPCCGGLVWFLQDLRPGAGWGIMDSDGNPKAAYYFLKRAWAPRRLALVDRGLDGLMMGLYNDTGRPMSGRVEATVLDPRGATLAASATDVHVEPRGHMLLDVEELLGHFADPTYSYRFGPLRHAAVEASFTSPDGAEQLHSVYWPDLAYMPSSVSLDAELGRDGGSVRTSGLARDVHVDLRSGTPDDNYRDVTPAAPMTFRVHGMARDGTRGFVSASNCRDAIRVRSDA